MFFLSRPTPCRMLTSGSVSKWLGWCSRSRSPRQRVADGVLDATAPRAVPRDDRGGRSLRASLWSISQSRGSHSNISNWDGGRKSKSVTFSRLPSICGCAWTYQQPRRTPICRFATVGAGIESQKSLASHASTLPFACFTKSNAFRRGTMSEGRGKKRKSRGGDGT